MSNQEKYPFWKEIRSAWKASKSHCNPSSKSKRQHYIEKGIKFDPQWLGEIGFLRYYLFCIDNGYVPGISKLQRKNENDGFNPQNCFIAHYPKDDNKNSDIKQDASIKSVNEAEPKTNVTNNIFIVDSIDAAKVLMSKLNGYAFD
jgi:hypothetical protein